MKNSERYNVDKIGERTKSCPTLMSTLKEEEENLFFYLLDNFGRIEKSQSQTQLCPK